MRAGVKRALQSIRAHRNAALLIEETRCALIHGGVLGMLQDAMLQRAFRLAHVVPSAIYRFLLYCWESHSNEILLLKTALAVTCNGIISCSWDERRTPPPSPLGISGAVCVHPKPWSKGLCDCELWNFGSLLINEIPSSMERIKETDKEPFKRQLRNGLSHLCKWERGRVLWDCLGAGQMAKIKS